MGEAVVSVPVALGMLLSFVVAWGLSHGWNVSFGPFLRWLGNLGFTIGKGVFKASVHPFGFALTIDKNMQHFFSSTMAMAEKRLVQALVAIVEPFLLMAGVTVALGLTGYEGLQALWHHVVTQVPKVIRETVVRPVERVTHATTRIVTVRVGNLEHAVKAAEARIAHAARVAAHAVAQPFPRIRDLERDVNAAKKWLKRHRYLAAYASLAALGLAILARLRLSWLRCGKVNRVGKFLCGKMDDGLLNSLLQDAALVGATIGLVEFAEELGGIVEPMSEGIAFLAGVAESAPALPDLIP